MYGRVHTMDGLQTFVRACSIRPGSLDGKMQREATAVRVIPVQGSVLRQSVYGSDDQDVVQHRPQANYNVRSSDKGTAAAQNTPVRYSAPQQLCQREGPTACHRWHLGCRCISLPRRRRWQPAEDRKAAHPAGSRLRTCRPQPVRPLLTSAPPAHCIMEPRRSRTTVSGSFAVSADRAGTRSWLRSGGREVSADLGHGTQSKGKL